MKIKPACPKDSKNVFHFDGVKKSILQADVKGGPVLNFEFQKSLPS